MMTERIYRTASGRPYTIIRSKRRTLAIQMDNDLTITVRAPMRSTLAFIRDFVASRERWIERTAAKITAARKKMPAPAAYLSEADLETLKQQARIDMRERADRFAAELGVSYGRISIRAQKTRWGSCSSDGNLNFNCLLMLTPPAVRDYVALHELCHRIEMNHSPKFWRLLEEHMPDYRERRKWLKENGPAVMASAKTARS